MTNTAQPNTLAAYLNHQIQLSGKKQSEIAKDCGFGAANVITMIKQGTTALPRDKVLKMANSLCIDPVYLLMRLYKESYPTELPMIEKILGQPVMTDTELEFLRLMRDANSVNPAISQKMIETLRHFQSSVSQPVELETAEA